MAWEDVFTVDDVDAPDILAPAPRLTQDHVDAIEDAMTLASSITTTLRCALVPGKDGQPPAIEGAEMHVSMARDDAQDLARMLVRIQARLNRDFWS